MKQYQFGYLAHERELLERYAQIHGERQRERLEREAQALAQVAVAMEEYDLFIFPPTERQALAAALVELGL